MFSNVAFKKVNCVKTVLVILTQPNLASLQVHESLSATMVLATFGSQVKVLMQPPAFSLLNQDLVFDAQKHPFKLASNLVDSFEFYDLSPILIEEKYKNHAALQNSEHEFTYIEMNAAFIASFDHVLYW